MTRAKLVKKLSQRMGVRKKDGELYFASFLDSIMDNLNKDGRVAFRGFGSFKINEYKARVARKPITGELIHLPVRRKISFHPGQELRERVNKEKQKGEEAQTIFNHNRASESMLSFFP